jgi:hypothetical protein
MPLALLPNMIMLVHLLFIFIEDKASITSGKNKTKNPFRLKTLLQNETH